MPYIEHADRNQIMMCSLDSFVDPQSDARLIDAFGEHLDLKELGFGKSEPADEGRPSYDTKDLMKLYIYGYRHKIRSSRKLKHACKVNIEVKWLMSGLEPDHRTISDFRKDNIDCLKAVFHEFNKRLYGVAFNGFQSIDGSKFFASNSKDNNFTASKLDDRIKWLDAHTEEYLKQIEEVDAMEDAQEIPGHLTKEELEMKLREAEERLIRYKGYQQYMEENGLSQLSTVDHDAKLMKNKNGFAVAYNVQTAIDSDTHLITDYQMTNQPTDHGLLNSTMSDIKASKEDEILEIVADKGYNCEDDMIECLENGIIPNVILPDGQDHYDLEVEYRESECDPSSTKAEELSKCLHAGVIPESYKDIIDSVEIKTCKRQVKPEAAVSSIYGSEEEMRSRAAEGYFVRDPERNLVYCPVGEILRQKSVRKNGEVRYINKFACMRCPYKDRCFSGKGKWKEIDFNKDTLEKPNRKWNAALKPDIPETKQKIQYETIKVVRFKFHPDQKKMNERFSLSEHPFGTLKRAMDAGYFLLRSLRKVAGEFALMCLGYNLVRAKNLLGFDTLMALMCA